ncbi:MAG: hypothetical protein R3Y27_02265 [Clostridia bacterium]
MKNTRKILAVLMSLVMALAVLPVVGVVAFAEEGITVSDYTALSAALVDGATITLGDDISATSVAVPAGTSITLDLNGYTLSSAVTCYGNLTIKDSTAGEATISYNDANDHATVTYDSGKITYSSATTVSAINGGSVTLESGMIEATGGQIAICATGDKTGETEIASTVTIAGGVVEAVEFAASAQGNGAILNVDGGVLHSTYNAVIAGNGTNNSTTKLGGTTINISGGIAISEMPDSADSTWIACGVYHPQSGTLNITGGTIIALGGVGVLMRGGEMNMTGGEIIATSKDSGKVGDSKIIAGSYGILIDGASSYYDGATASVAINGGSVSADDTLLAIVDGTATNTIVIVDGEFNQDVSEYLEEGAQMTANEDGTYSVETVETTIFDTMQEMIDKLSAFIQIMIDTLTDFIAIFQNIG